MDNRRKWTLAIIVVFMLVTISHVALYAASFEPQGSAWLGWPYALAVEASIIICAYFTKWKTTRAGAWAGYFAFVFASGVMNIGYIQPATFPAWNYALFPTVAIALLGFLYRQIDKLVEGAESRRKSTGKSRKAPTHLPESPGKRQPALPEWLGNMPETKRQFLEMVRNGEIRPEGVTGADLERHIPAVGSGKTGRNWLRDARNVNGKETNEA